MPRFTRIGLTFGLVIGVLMVAVGGGAASAFVRPVPSNAVAPHVFPASSCQGANACDGVAGSVGNHSCNGDHACYNAAGNSVGNRSCVGDRACDSSLKYIGSGSCVGTSACDHIGGTVADGSCNGDPSRPLDAPCPNATGPIGAYACNGPYQGCANAGTVPDCFGNYVGFIPAPCFSTLAVMGSSELRPLAGQRVMIWATVLSRFPAMGVPRGTFQFRVDGEPRGAPVSIDRHGRAAITLVLQQIGLHSVSGRYIPTRLPGHLAYFSTSSPVPIWELVKPAPGQAAGLSATR